eukprot:gene10278-2426_t
MNYMRKTPRSLRGYNSGGSAAVDASGVAGGGSAAVDASGVAAAVDASGVSGRFVLAASSLRAADTLRIRDAVRDSNAVDVLIARNSIQGIISGVGRTFSSVCLVAVAIVCVGVAVGDVDECSPNASRDVNGRCLCDKGMAFIAYDEPCIPCDFNHFKDSSSNNVCQQCAPGKFTSSTGAFDCEFCTEGFYLNENNLTKCQPGFFCVNCNITACLSNTFQPESGQYTCQNCAQTVSYDRIFCDGITDVFFVDFSETAPVLEMPGGLLQNITLLPMESIPSLHVTAFDIVDGPLKVIYTSST